MNRRAATVRQEEQTTAFCMVVGPQVPGSVSADPLVSSDSNPPTAPMDWAEEERVWREQELAGGHRSRMAYAEPGSRCTHECGFCGECE